MNATSTEPQQGMTVLGGMLIAFAMSWFSIVWAAIPWTAAFILARRYKFRIYTLNKPDECKRIQRRVQERSSHTTNNGKGYGWAFGYWYIIHMDVDRDGDPEVWMIASEKSYEGLTKDLDDEEEEEDENENTVVAPPIMETKPNAKKLHILDRRGSYANFWYRTRSIKSLGLVPRPEQAAIMENIKTTYQQKGRGVFYIYGPPNTGKSIIGTLIAEQFGGNYTNTFCPWQPGNTLGDITDELDLTREKPIVVAFDEVDIALLKIHEGTIPDHKNLPTLIQDKTGWNRFLDNFQRGLFPFMILLMTSNKPPQFINALDTSYLRPGRVDEIFELSVKSE